MRLKKLIIVGASVLILTTTGLYIHNKFTEDESKISSNNKMEEFKQFDEVYSSEINKNYDGSYLDRLVTMVEAKEEFKIKIKNIDKNAKVTLINSSIGEMTDLNYTEGNGFVLDTKLNEGIDYGILLDNRLIGSIRVVNGLEKADKEKIYEEVMENLQCGL
ncbi:hypothetical protein CHL78_006265 [Romboutsia weinsteinii]|uniref:Uncharacterized protein n=1 Tax=Romboutsia weinsteinii TaxID=2020949 RepID=A0A371J604_9FIRM|nr:hypothetical protein [Romboutsia weinsteinii]RDY28189.1 hypothetical protein CHL78_006265 [Romboutsia weinsteinii]